MSSLRNRWEHDDEHWWTTLDGRSMDNQMKAQTSGILKVLAWCWAPKSEYRPSWRLAQHLQVQPRATHLSISHISAVSITSENWFSWSMMIIWWLLIQHFHAFLALPPCLHPADHEEPRWYCQQQTDWIPPVQPWKLAPQEQNVSA